MYISRDRRFEPQPAVAVGALSAGSLLLETGKKARAIDELETAQRLSPEEPKIYFALGRAYTRAHRKEEAERAQTEFERLNKK